MKTFLLFLALCSTAFGVTKVEYFSDFATLDGWSGNAYLSIDNGVLVIEPVGGVLLSQVEVFKQGEYVLNADVYFTSINNSVLEVQVGTGPITVYADLWQTISADIRFVKRSTLRFYFPRVNPSDKIYLRNIVLTRVGNGPVK